MADERLCDNCANILKTQPMPRCGAGRIGDLVSGEPHRFCIIERIDGIGRCGSIGNNFTLRTEEAKSAKTVKAVKK